MSKRGRTQRELDEMRERHDRASRQSDDAARTTAREKRYGVTKVTGTEITFDEASDVDASWGTVANYVPIPLDGTSPLHGKSALSAWAAREGLTFTEEIVRQAAEMIQNPPPVQPAHIQFRTSRRMPPGRLLMTQEAYERLRLGSWTAVEEPPRMTAAQERLAYLMERRNEMHRVGHDLSGIQHEINVLRHHVEQEARMNAPRSAPTQPNSLLATEISEQEYREEAFKKEWAEIIGLYTVAKTAEIGSQMARLAVAALRERCKRHRLKFVMPSVRDGAEVLERLAPRYMLRPFGDFTKIAESAFGPSVTAESEEDLADIMRMMNNDPRYRDKMSGSGFLVTSTPGAKPNPYDGEVDV